MKKSVKISAIALLFLGNSNSQTMLKGCWARCTVPGDINEERNREQNASRSEATKGKARVEETSQPKNLVSAREFLAENAASQPSAVSQPVKVEPISQQASPVIEAQHIQTPEEILVESKALTKNEFALEQAALIRTAIRNFSNPYDVEELLQTYSKHMRTEFPGKSNIRKLKIYNREIISHAKLYADISKAIAMNFKCLSFENQTELSTNSLGHPKNRAVVETQYNNAHTNLYLVEKRLKKLTKHRKSKEKITNSENGKSCYN